MQDPVIGDRICKNKYDEFTFLGVKYGDSARNCQIALVALVQKSGMDSEILDSAPPADDEVIGPSSNHGKAPAFVIMHSVSKKHNVGTIARCATAFGVKQVRRLEP